MQFVVVNTEDVETNTRKPAEPKTEFDPTYWQRIKLSQVRSDMPEEEREVLRKILYGEKP